MRRLKPILIDGYCGVGGMARGYQQAGFHVIGVDINPQPRYAGDEFVQCDAIEFIREHGRDAAAVHASPPCQASCTLTTGTNRHRGFVHPQLIPATRKALEATGRPWVIENVQGAEVRRDITLCGEMFGLGVIRHRYFELGGWTMLQPAHVKHRGRVAGWRHGVLVEGPYFQVYGSGGRKGSVAQWQQAMGIDWTDDRRELAEAIPPAYAEAIGISLLSHLREAVPAWA